MYLMGCGERECKEIGCGGYSTEAAGQDFCRGISGTISVNAVSCNWHIAKEPKINYDHIRALEEQQTPLELGSVFVDVRRDTWIEVPLDITKVRKVSEFSLTGNLCLNVVAGKTLNKTMVIFGARMDGSSIPTNYVLQSAGCRECDAFTRAGFGKMPHPQLVLVQGRSYNCTGTGCSIDCSGDKGNNVYSDECTGTLWSCGADPKAPGYNPQDCSAGARVRDQTQLSWKPMAGACVLHILNGTTIRDSRVNVRGTIEPLNVVLGDISFESPGDLNNAMGTNLENITVSIVDTAASYLVLKQGGWFDSFEEAKYTGIAKTMIQIIPRKHNPLDLYMVPVYSEPWVSETLFLMYLILPYTFLILTNALFVCIINPTAGRSPSKKSASHVCDAGRLWKPADQ
jgi:hypothetical protein